jgi:rfaE bifunctional protein kinase chain/domain
MKNLKNFTSQNELIPCCNGSDKDVIDIRQAAGDCSRIVFVWGIFNVIHSGHLRLLNFAATCGDFLVVGVFDDKKSGVMVPEHLRLEGVQAINLINYSFVLRVPPEDFIAQLKPSVVVKGKEHELHFNPEQSIIKSYGGRLLFSSGEIQFSSMNLLQQEFNSLNHSTIQKPTEFLLRHGINLSNLTAHVQKFSSLKVVVIGDLIIDEYITCDPLGMSQEDPSIVVTPIKHDFFVGGAGIVAAHASGLGAEVQLFSVIGDDSTAIYARKTLEAYRVHATLLTDASRPTTLKQRYRAHSKTLLKVSQLRQHDIDNELIESLLEQIIPAIEQADLLIFSDFNYGCLPQRLVEEVINHCERIGVRIAADSQSSSQIGNISRFSRVHLITPTEHEARLAIRDIGTGLVVLANALYQQSMAKHIIITLGSEGLFIHAPSDSKGGPITDQLPAFNSAPKDVSGAGDSLLLCASMALAVGATIWESAYLGSVASACQVGRVGNIPLEVNEIIQELSL